MEAVDDLEAEEAVGLHYNIGKLAFAVQETSQFLDEIDATSPNCTIFRFPLEIHFNARKFRLFLEAFSDFGLQIRINDEIGFMSLFETNIRKSFSKEEI